MTGEPVRPPGGGGRGGECLGRSRGGFSTKIHLAADGRCRPLALVLTPGQYGDNPQFEAVMAKISVPRTGPGRPCTRPDSVSADRAYSSRETHAYLRRRKIPQIIPEPRDQQANRRRRGSSGGRPTGFDKERYKKRNVVERANNRLKNYRAVATRYDKRAYVYLGTVTVAMHRGRDRGRDRYRGQLVDLDLCGTASSAESLGIPVLRLAVTVVGRGLLIAVRHVQGPRLREDGIGLTHDPGSAQPLC